MAHFLKKIDSALSVIPQTQFLSLTLRHDEYFIYCIILPAPAVYSVVKLVKRSPDSLFIKQQHNVL